MTDWQAVRDWVAEHVMGWVKSTKYDEFFEYEDGTPLWFKTADLNHAMGPVTGWQPDMLWADCGMVIEAMERQGWRLRWSTDAHDRWVEFSKTDTQYRWAEVNDCDTNCQAVTLAAAYATGYQEVKDD